MTSHAFHTWIRATAVTGEVAYSSVGYAWLGLAMHSGISLLWAGVYGGLAARLPALRRHALVSSPVFGLLVFTLMQLAQWINGTWAAPESAALAHYLVDHALFFGLPVAVTFGVLAERSQHRTPGVRLKLAA